MIGRAKMIPLDMYKESNDGKFTALCGKAELHFVRFPALYLSTYWSGVGCPDCLKLKRGFWDKLLHFVTKRK